jgi:hypothetical protein
VAAVSMGQQFVQHHFAFAGFQTGDDVCDTVFGVLVIHDDGLTLFLLKPLNNQSLLPNIIVWKAR